MKIVSITTMIPTRSGFAWWPCELVGVPANTPDDQAIQAAYNELRDAGCLLVVKLDIEPIDGRRRGIRSRMPAVLGKPMIGTITPMHLELVEAA